MNEAQDILHGTDRDLTLVREFEAPRELVFKLWTNPEYLIKWMGPRHHPSVHHEADVRPGGIWRGCLQSVERPDVLLWQGGSYLEVVPPEKLVFTFAWDDGPETVCTVLLTEQKGKTRMVFHQTPFETAGNRDGHGEGWSSSFDRLADLLVRSAQGERE